ncbi:MAG: hypothetical protein ACYTEQ_12175 [Planctomycetota bacterium]|jgi:hypothetical protein
MNPNRPFLVYKHPVEGEICLSLAGEMIRFSCRWPFDLHTDEWIYINNEFHRDTYIRSLSSLSEKGSVRVNGNQAGYIEFTVLSGDEVRIEVVDAREERPPRLVQPLGVSPGDLLPGRRTNKK